MALLAILLTILATGLAYYFYKKKNIFEHWDIPYDRPKPILGSMTPCVLRKMTIFQLIQKIYNTHPEAKYVGMYDFQKPVIIIRDPEIIKSITIKNFDLFVDHQELTDEKSDKIFGKNLFTLKGDEWKEVRHILNPLFTSSKMKTIFNLVLESTVEFMDTWTQKLKNESNIINLKDVFTKLTADIIVNCALGIKINSINDPENEVYVIARNASNFAGFLSFKFLLIRNLKSISRLFSFKIFNDNVRNFFKGLVIKNVKTRIEEGITRQDFLQMMIEAEKNNRKMSDLEISANAFSFLIGGLDAVSTALGFILHEIAINQDVHKRLQEDIDVVLENCDGQPTYNDINSVTYLEAVINEGLRLYPLSGFIDRVCKGNFELPPVLPGKKPLTVGPGTLFWIPMFALHRDPNHYPNPEKFDPERFLGANKINVNSGTYITFGIGPRICIGMRFAILKLKVMVFHLLAKCNFKPCSKTSVPIKLLTNSFHLLPEGGFWLNVEVRK